MSDAQGSCSRYLATRRALIGSVAGVSGVVLSVGLCAFLWGPRAPLHPGPPQDWTHIAGAIAWLVVMLLPAIWGTLALFGRPTLFPAAAMASMAYLLLSALLVPAAIVIGSLFYLAAAMRIDPARTHPGRMLAAIFVPILFTVFAVAALLQTYDSPSWAPATPAIAAARISALTAAIAAVGTAAWLGRQSPSAAVR